MKTSKKKYNSRKNKKSNKNVKNYSRKNKINKINKLKGGNLDENILQSILTNDPTFTILNINRNYFGTEGAKALATALTVNTSLITLEISMNNISPDGAKALAGALASNATLTKIDISINDIGPEGAKAFAKALGIGGNITLTILNISGNQIGPEGAKAFAEALGIGGNITLTTLDISNNYIGPAGAIALARALAGMTALTILYISNNYIGPAGAEALTEALQNNAKLTTLDIRANNIGPDGAKALAGALASNATLTTLDIRGNNIGDEGAIALAGALAINATLTTLDIRFNQIGDAGAQALAGALQGNTKLTTLLYINRNLIINNESVEALLNALKVNKTLKIIDIEEIIDSSHNDIKQKIMKILKNRKNNSIIFNPILKSIDTTTDTDEITNTINFIKANIRVKPKLLSDKQLKTLTESDIETINSKYKNQTIDEYIQYLISFSQPDDKKLPETDNTNQFYSLIDNNNKSGALAISNIETSQKYLISLHGEVRSTIFKLPENINIVFLSPIRYLICKKNDISILQNIATNINTFLTNPYCAEIQQNFRQSLIYLGGQYCPDLSLSRSIKDHVTGIHYINSNTLQNAYAYDSGKLDTTLSQFLNDENDSQRTKFSSNKETQYTIILILCRETEHLSNLTADVLVFYEQLVKLINYRIYYNNFLKTKLTFNNNVNQAYKYCRTLKYTNIDIESKHNNINQLQMYRNKNNNNNNNSKGKFYSRNSNNTNNTTLITKLKQKITDYKLNPITIDKQDLFELLITNLKFEKNIFHNQEKYKNSIYSKDKDKFDIIKKIFGNDYDLMFEFVLNVDAQFHIINFKYIFKDKNKIDINKITYRITLSELKFILIFFDKTLNEFKNLNLGIKKEEIKDLVDILQNNTTITTLYIISNNIDSEGAKALSGALAGMISLTELNISDNNIGPAGAIALAGALAGMTALTTLDISNNFFGNDGAQALAGAIAGNKILTTLNIGNNNIGNEGAQDLAKALQTNETLTTLDISGNNFIGIDGINALAEALKTNTTLTKLIFSSFFINDTVKTQLETNTRIQFV